MCDAEIIGATEHWVRTVVVGLNFCPFAKREMVAGRIRYVVSRACDEESLLRDLQVELGRMVDHPAIETTLLIHPQVLQDFNAYNDFLGLADACVAALDLEGVLQVASFHPDYQFADSLLTDVENYTNKSPYPMLHLIREASITEALAHHPDPDRIPQNNMEKTRKLGLKQMESLLQACFMAGEKIKL